MIGEGKLHGSPESRIKPRPRRADHRKIQATTTIYAGTTSLTCCGSGADVALVVQLTTAYANPRAVLPRRG
jgi:hypothetical protein